ncbi:LacI family DNA-binding transcriptional regulator [Nocardioides sp.]|uniref:LacI family DNA-binding transcriptional regulator n=1 Tax=Nocardioides sp. TaxID=35761 RepID=UPI002610A4E1|nr:LacI family DNA-binding transcriptional regulator [Nocardioides sp.]
MPKVTLQSIADEVGVSRMTVSNAFSRPEKLSADLRARILAVAEELGYVGPDPAARALARGRTGTVGLLLTGRMSEQAADPVATEFLVAVADALSDHGLALTLITAGVGGETVPARDVPMDGALVYVCEPDSTDLAWLRRRDLPLVTVDQEALPGAPAINVDDRAGARAAAQHVVDLGHRRVGLLNLHPVTEEAPEATPPDAPWNPPAAERDRGWRSALSAAGIDPLEELAAFRPVEAAYDAARRLLDRPAAERPTALLCFSDGYAAQAMRAAESLGLKVPEDVSVVGFDDSSIATAVHPALTTVSQPVTEKGRLAVAALLDAMRGGGPGETPADPVRTVLPTSLVVRGSTAPPPA